MHVSHVAIVATCGSSIWLTGLLPRAGWEGNWQQFQTPSPTVPTKRKQPAMFGSRFWFHPAFAAVTGALITYLMLSRRDLETKLVKQKGYPNAWSLTIQLRFKDTESRVEFLKHWAPLARYVRDAEPFCLLFEAIQSDKDPLLLIVDERYIDKNVYVEKHRSSAAFHAFRPHMQKLQDEAKVEVLGESGIGISLDSI